MARFAQQISHRITAPQPKGAGKIGDVDDLDRASKRKPKKGEGRDSSHKIGSGSRKGRS